MTRLFRSLHAWGGFALSSLIIVISLTGSLLVWKKEFLLLTVPEARGAIELTPAAAAKVTQQAESLFGSDDILVLQFQSENTALTKVFLTDSQYAYLDKTGNLVDQWTLNERPEEWLYDLHHRLLLGNTGLLISGLAALVLLGLIIPGLIAWWPTRRGFSWRVFVRRTFTWNAIRPNLLATHRNLGILSIFPIALLLITALLLSFPEQAQQILVAPHRMQDAYSDLYIETLDEISGRENGQLESSFQRAQSIMGGARIRSIQLPSGNYQAYNLIGLQREGDWHSGGLSRVYIYPESGTMDMTIDSSRLPTSEKLYNLSYPLHTGKVDSLIYRLFLTIIGASLFLLSALGLVSFIKKLSKGITKGRVEH
jgi:uncharacterized iron-regulated membrane protein